MWVALTCGGTLIRLQELQLGHPLHIRLRKTDITVGMPHLHRDLMQNLPSRPVGEPTTELIDDETKAAAMVTVAGAGIPFDVARLDQASHMGSIDSSLPWRGDSRNSDPVAHQVLNGGGLLTSLPECWPIVDDLILPVEAAIAPQMEHGQRRKRLGRRQKAEQGVVPDRPTGEGISPAGDCQHQCSGPVYSQLHSGITSEMPGPQRRDDPARPLASKPRTLGSSWRRTSRPWPCTDVISYVIHYEAIGEIAPVSRLRRQAVW
jgi:hypothetical protein